MRKNRGGEQKLKINSDLLQLFFEYHNRFAQTMSQLVLDSM